MGTNCGPLVADLILSVMKEIPSSLSHEKIRLTLLRLSIPLPGALTPY